MCRFVFMVRATPAGLTLNYCSNLPLTDFHQRQWTNNLSFSYRLAIWLAINGWLGSSAMYIFISLCSLEKFMFLNKFHQRNRKIKNVWKIIPEQYPEVSEHIFFDPNRCRARSTHLSICQFAFLYLSFIRRYLHERERHFQTKTPRGHF